MKNSVIGVLPVGDIPNITGKIIAAHIYACFKLSAEVLPPYDIPLCAFDARRNQYNAGIVLESLKTGDFNVYEKVIGVCSIDLFIPIFTHVFGEAKLGGRFAIVSCFRLRENPVGEMSSVCFERLAKVALHELGHLFGKLHCNDKQCLMHFSGSLEGLDAIRMGFCRYCF